MTEKQPRQDTSQHLASLRARIREESFEHGTATTIPTAGDGWAARAEDFRANDSQVRASCGDEVPDI